MSTAVSEIINQAFRDGNFVAVGEDPTAAEVAEAMPRLNNLIASLFGIELGEVVREWPVPTVWYPTAPLRSQLMLMGESAAESWAYPPANVRLVVRITAPSTVYFPLDPQDGARIAYADVGSSAALTLNGNGRLIDGEEEITGSPPAEGNRTWLYRADLGNWIQLKNPLAADDEVPLPPEFDDLLVTGLAIRLGPRFGVKIDDTIIARFVDMSSRLKKRYKQTEGMPVAETLVFPEL